MPFAVITCGPASAPIDKVRRITNFSTGEIGTVLAGAFFHAGFDILCLRGEGATAVPPTCGDVRSFFTNDSLAEALRCLDRQPDVILHAAALSDFEVAEIHGSDASAKLSSRAGEIQLTLRPAKKILPELRSWFPAARLIGWKYELDGSRDQAVSRAAKQICEARSDACVVTGAAYGPGFGVLTPDGNIAHFADKPSLAAHLAGIACGAGKVSPQAF